MSGAAGGGRKDKKDLSGGKEVSAPAVVTGAYLTCNYSSAGSTNSNQDSVGCSVIDNGSPVEPTKENKLAFYRSFKNGPYIKPSKINATSEPQALFAVPKTETGESRYLATLANDYGIDEFSCNTLPCDTPIKLQAKPSFVKLDAKAIWIMSDPINTAINAMPFLFNYIDTDSYCDTSGSAKIGTNPAINYATGFPIKGGSTRIEAISAIYAERANFRKHKLKDGSYYAQKSSGGCIVVPLRRSGSPFYADGISKSGPYINTDRFDLILPNTTENFSLVQEFLKDIP